MCVCGRAKSHTKHTKLIGTIKTCVFCARNSLDMVRMLLGTLILLLVAAFTLRLCFKLRTRSGNDKSPPLPPGPRGLPVFGYLPFLGDNLQRKFAELADAYGPIYKLWLGSKLYVVVSSPEIAKEIVREQDIRFSNRNANIACSIISFGGKDIAFADYGPYWRRMRKLFVKEVMSGSSLDACYDLRRKAIRKSVVEIGKMAGSHVEIGKVALRSTISMLWGNSVGEERGGRVDSDFRSVVRKMMKLLGKPNVSDFFPVLSRFDLQGIEKESREVRVWFEQFLDSLIKSVTEEVKRRSEEKGEESSRDETKKDFLQLLLELDFDNEDDHPKTAPGSSSSSSSNNRHIMGILMDIVIGGTDTTATMVEWVMAELMHHQDVMKKVMEELTEVIGVDSMAEEHHLHELKYLMAVVKETFRLHPALPLVVPRCPDTSSVVGGYTIPKGCTVFLNAAYIHTNPKLWDKPLDFVPERFLRDSNKYDFSGNNFEYLPFGSGRRMCAGIPLAEKLLMFILASFLHSFDWKLPEGTKLEFSNDLGLVSKKSIPLVAIPQPRLDNTEFYKYGTGVEDK